MAEDELAAFRERWKHELTSKKDEQRLVCAPSPSWVNAGQADQRDLKNRYFEEKNNNPTKPEKDGCTRNEASVKAGRGSTAAGCEDQPEYVSIARSLLDGRCSPLLDRIQEERSRRKREYQSTSSESLQPQTKTRKEEKLVDQLIEDLV